MHDREKEWQEYIHVEPNVLAGKPVIKGTRLGVGYLVRLVAAGWSEQQLLDSFPTLTRDGLRAALAYAAELVDEQRVYPAPLEAHAVSGG